MTQALYLYGIAGTAGLSLPPVHGMEGGVTGLEHGGLSAIVGAPPKGGFQELSREKAVRLLLCHQEVLEAAMMRAAVLPVKFGTVAPSEAAIRSLLQQQSACSGGPAGGVRRLHADGNRGAVEAGSGFPRKSQPNPPSPKRGGKRSKAATKPRL